MRKHSHHQARLQARSSRQQELPFPTNVFPVLKDALNLMARRPALEHLLAALLKSSEEGVLTVSPTGAIESWSAGAERLYGYTAEEMLGQSLSRLLPVYESPQVEPFLSQGGDEGRPLELSERLHKNGSRILLAIRRSVIRGDHGEPEGILEMAQALAPHEAFWSPGEAPLRLLMEQVPGLLWTTAESKNSLALGQRPASGKDSPDVPHRAKRSRIPGRCRSSCHSHCRALFGPARRRFAPGIRLEG
jgi:PAS domain S-box-containing protein